jgi:signal transduction histidine kinase
VSERAVLSAIKGPAMPIRWSKKKNGQIGIVFLDQSMIFKNTHDLMLSGIILGIISLILFEFVLIMSSKRAIKPVIEAEQRQKEFITNAGHELKTPAFPSFPPTPNWKK